MSGALVQLVPLPEGGAKSSALQVLISSLVTAICCPSFQSADILSCGANARSQTCHPLFEHWIILNWESTKRGSDEWRWAECDLNHLGYGLRAVDAWRISFLPRRSLPVFSKCNMMYFNAVRLTARLKKQNIDIYENDFLLFCRRKRNKADIKKTQKLKKDPSSRRAGSCFLGNMSGCNDSSSCVLWDG